MNALRFNFYLRTLFALFLRAGDALAALYYFVLGLAACAAQAVAEREEID